MQVDFVKRTRRQFWLEGFDSVLTVPRYTDTVRLEVCKFDNRNMVRVVAEYASGCYTNGRWCECTPSIDQQVFKAVKDAEWIVKQKRAKHGRKKVATQRKTSASA